MEYSGLMAFVDDFFVRPAFRNSGLGTAALAAARDACAMLGVRAMAVEVAGDNESTLAVYRRTGFAMTDRKLMVLAWPRRRTTQSAGAETHLTSRAV